MSSREKILDDAAQLAGGAVGIISNLKHQVGEGVRTKVNSVAQDMDLVPREDYEALETLFHALKEEINDVKKRLEALENKK